MINVTKIVLETKSKYIDKQFLVDSVNCLLRTESCLENVGVIDLICMALGIMGIMYLL